MKIHPLIFTLLITLVPNYVIAQDARMLVLDGSGSMWAQFGSKTKIEAVRRALSQSLKTAATEQPLGLVLFGHRRKGSCQDVQTLVDPAPATGKAIAWAARNLNPTGRSAIGKSIQAAASALKSRGESARIMLITDGLGQCSPKLCEQASQLKIERPGLFVDVIGLGLSNAKAKRLACLASNTGGEYFPATNTNEILAAMTQFLSSKTTTSPVSNESVVENSIELKRNEEIDGAPTDSIKPVEAVKKFTESAQPASTITSKAPDTQEKLDKLARIPSRASGTKDDVVKPVGDKSAVRIKVVLASDAGSYDLGGLYKFYALSGGRPEITPNVKGYGTVANASLPPGRYLLRYSKDLVDIEYPFEVRDGAPFEHTLALNAAVVTIGLAPGSGKTVDKRGSVQIFNGALRGTGFGKVTRVVPAGEIKIVGELGKSSIESTFNVQPGMIVERIYVASAAHLNVTATFTKGGKPVQGRIISHQVYPLDPIASGTNHPVAQSFGKGQFIVPPGDYVVRSVLGDTVVDSTVSLSTDKPTDLVVNMNAGTLAVTALKARRISVLSKQRNKNGKRTVLSTDYGETYQVILPPGEYVVAATYGDSTQVAEQTISVVAGERTETQISQ